MKSVKAKGHAEKTRQFRIIIQDTQWYLTIPQLLPPAVIQVKKEISGVCGLSLSHNGATVTFRRLCNQVGEHVACYPA